MPLLQPAGAASAAFAGWTAIDARIAPLVAGLPRQRLPLLIVAALCVLIAPVAVYLATSDE